MKKYVVGIFILISILLIGNVSNAASDFSLTQMDFDVTLNEDGSMNVIETWNIYVHGTTNTLFKTFELDASKYSGITDVEVCQIDRNGDKIEFREKNEEVLHVDKNCYYALVNSSGKFEIAWGINEKIGTKTYQISYKVEDCIKKYNDISELYWKFVGNDFSMDIESVTGTIHIPNTSNDKSTIRAWAHGPLNGNISIDSAKEVSFEVEYLDKGNFVEVRLAMPNEAFSGITNALNTNRLDTILTEETYLADEANRAREDARKQLERREKIADLIKLILPITGVILTLYFLTRINK